MGSSISWEELERWAIQIYQHASGNLSGFATLNLTTLLIVSG